MPTTKLSISAPPDTWVHAVSTAHPETTIRVVTALVGERNGVALVELRTPDPLAPIGAMEDRDDVTSLDLLWTHEAETLVQVRTVGAPLLLPLWQAGVPVQLPFAIKDGTATWEVTTSSDRLSDLGTRLDEAGVDYHIEYVQDVGTGRADRLLTDRQQEVLLAARDAGYYATPREATLTEVAGHLGVSKATASDVLHRAEGSIVEWFAEEHLDGGGVKL